MLTVCLINMDNRVEIKKIGGLIGHFDLIIDGKRRLGVSVNESSKTKLKTLFTVKSETIKSSRNLAYLSFNQFYLANIEEIILANWRKLNGFFIDILLKRNQLKIVLEPDLKNWKQNYSHTFYLEKLFSIVSNDEWSKSDNFSVVIVDFRLTMTFPRDSGVDNLISIDDEIKDKFQKLLGWQREIIDSYEKTENSNLISVFFNLPDELKVFCEQYLLYFVQFLSDLGINATSNLKEEAGKVLFSITPTDDVEALEKIREALAVYLKLPESPIVYDDSFAAMRLQQQIENLQHSQRMKEREIRSSDRELRLAQTVIESQDKVILQKDTIIEQQNKVIEKITSKSIMMDSLENKAEFEKVFDGLEFGESKELKEKLGIKFNPVTSLKTIGRKLTGSNNEIISLNLNEETDEIIER